MNVVEIGAPALGDTDVSSSVSERVSGPVSPDTAPEAAETLDVSPVSAKEGEPKKGLRAAEARKPLDCLSPSPDPVDGAHLLDAMVAMFRRHLVLPPGGAETMALWVLFSHTLDAHKHSPRLLFRSPTNGCGKTNALDLITQMVQCPIPCSSASPAVIYRSIELYHPTLIFDEADNFLRRSLEYKEIMNGYTRSTAFVSRSKATASNDWKPEFYCIWAAYVLAWNEEHGSVWATLRSRCLDIPMKRRKRGEDVEDVTSATLVAARELGEKAVRWGQDNIEKLVDANPKMPAGIINRPADNWRPLLAIGDLVGGRWPALARTLPDPAACAVTELAVELLRDIREIMNKRGGGRIGSMMLCNALAALDDRPWSTYNDRGADLKITQEQVAEILAPFDIGPKVMRLPGQNTTRRGYEAAWFEDACERYDPPGGAEGETGETHNETSDL